MENHRNFRDFLSQGCSSSTSRNRTDHEAPEDDDFGTFSQSLFALPPRINVPAPRSRIEALDLNSQSQGTDFPYLSSDQDVLRTGDGGSDLGLSPLGRGRSARTLFQSTRSISAPISHARGAIRGCRVVRGRCTSSRGGGRSAISAPIDPVLIEDFGDEPTNEIDSRAPVVRKKIHVLITMFYCVCYNGLYVPQVVIKQDLYVHHT
jgi:hypothetical protein